MSQLQPFAAEHGFEIVDDDGSTQKLRGLVDPSANPGIPAPISSQYNRQSAVEDEVAIYLKFGPNDTDWRRLASGEDAGIIGSAEDGDYTDGLFTDFSASTPVGTPIDRFNEILKALAPPPAPALSQINMAQSGATAKLSFGPTNPIAGYSDVDGTGDSAALDINDTFSFSGNTRGVFGSITSISGTLNPQVAAESEGAYPADSFGNADQGTLELEVNGTVVHTIDLSSFGSGSDVNGNGSGFNLSAATSVEFSDGTPLDQFKYRTGSWDVDVADLRNGYNHIRISHNISGSSWSNYVDFVYDPEATAMSATGGLLDTLVMTGSKHLSGVEYYTDGSAQYDVTINDAHRNVYPTGNAISFATTNCSATSQAFGNISDEAATEVITDKAISVTNTGRLLDAGITVGLNVSHPLKSNLSSVEAQTIDGLLLDGVGANSTDTFESFNDEDYRIQDTNGANTNDYNAQSDVTNAQNDWDSTLDISSAGTAGHANGLLVYDGSLRYPTQGLDAGDFRNVGDGNADGPENGPAGNPNYNAETGNAVLIRQFVNNSGLTKANFKINISGTGDFADVATGPNAQALTVEMKFPDGSITTGTGWMDAYGDFATGQYADGDGARLATSGAGRSMGTDWGLTVGTKSIAAGESVLIRITAPDTWTGQITAINFTWL